MKVIVIGSNSFSGSSFIKKLIEKYDQNILKCKDIYNTVKWMKKNNYV